MNERQEPWSPGAPHRIYALLAEMVARGEAGAVATVIRTARSVPRHAGSKLVLRADGSTVGSVGGGRVEARTLEAARETARDGECRRLVLDLAGADGVCGGETEIFVEPVTLTSPCWVIGAGHVGRAVVASGAELPFRFTLVDDRPEFLVGLEPVETIPAAPGELAAALAPTPRTSILLANRNHDLDGDYLEAVFAAEERTGQEAGFVGVVGSARKARHLAARFEGEPARRERFARVRIPVGLSVGAETPPELALSILGELLAVRRGVAWLPDAAGRPQGVYLQRCRPPGKDSK